VSLPHPLRALAASDPERARTIIRTALDAAGGSRARAASRLAASARRWLPREGSYQALWRCIVALDMGQEIAERWPVAPRAETTAKEASK
jgi:hypothetical protein